MDGMNAISPPPFASYYPAFGAPDSQSFAPVSPVSPISLFSTLDDFGTDFTSESTSSPTSPVSPEFPERSYGCSEADDWRSWDNAEDLPESDNLFQYDLFEGSFLPPGPAQKTAMSPAINPMDLAIPPTGSFLFEQPMPQSSPMLTAASIARQPREATAPSTKRYPRRNLKRKSVSSTSDEGDVLSNKRGSLSSPLAACTGSDEGTEGPKKTAHNMIEKRYRTNLNDKIAQLRDAVPALRGAAQRFESLAGNDVKGQFVDGGLCDLGPVQKLNKATVLSRATEYIAQLERHNRNLEAENGALKGRAEGLQMLLMGRGGVAGVWN